MPQGYVLVVDDHAGVRQLLYTLLTQEGYLVETTENGSECLAMVKVKEPDLIILDVKMPIKSGLETLAELENLVPEIPVLMMTAYFELKIINMALKSSLVKHCLQKPFDLYEVRNLINSLVKKRTHY